MKRFNLNAAVVLALLALIAPQAAAQNFTIDSLTEQTAPSGTDLGIIDEGGGVYKKVQLDNWANAGYVSGRQVMWIPAGALAATTTSGAAPATLETTAGRPDIISMDFATDADDHAQFQVAFPDAWNEGTVTFQGMWSTTGAVTTGIALAFQGVCAANDDTIDAVYGTAVVVTDDATGVAEDLLITPESAAMTFAGTPTAGELCFIDVYRDVSNANDDMTQDMKLIGVKVFWTTVAPTDD